MEPENRNLNSEDGAQASREHPVDVPNHGNAIGDLDSENGVRASRVQPGGNVGIENGGHRLGQGANGNPTRTVLFGVGFLILVISGAFLFTVPFRLLSRFETFVVYCSVFLGLMVVFLAVVLP